MTIANEELVKKLKKTEYFGLSLMQRELRSTTLTAQRKLIELEREGLIEKDVKNHWRYRVK